MVKSTVITTLCHVVRACFVVIYNNLNAVDEVILNQHFAFLA